MLRSPCNGFETQKGGKKSNLLEKEPTRWWKKRRGRFRKGKKTEQAGAQLKYRRAKIEGEEGVF